MAQAVVDVRIAVGPYVDEPNATQRAIHLNAWIGHHPSFRAICSLRILPASQADALSETSPPDREAVSEVLFRPVTENRKTAVHIDRTVH